MGVTGREKSQGEAQLNPYLTNGFSHLYHLGEPTFIFMGVGSDFLNLIHFLMKIL